MRRSVISAGTRLSDGHTTPLTPALSSQAMGGTKPGKLPHSFGGQSKMIHAPTSRPAGREDFRYFPAVGHFDSACKNPGNVANDPDCGASAS